jgi:RNA polymerase sigma-70 factor (ECF subfamily)
LARDKDAILQELLVLRCRRGERRALDELIAGWQGRLFYYIRRLVGSEEDAWDVLQQTWMKVFKGIKTLNAADRLGVWLYTIARCAAQSHWRSDYRRQSRLDEAGDLAQVAADGQPDSFDDAEQVHLGLSRLSPAHREVLMLYFLEDFSLDEMGQVLGIPSGTVKSRLFYGRQALRAALESKEGTP